MGPNLVPARTPFTSRYFGLDIRGARAPFMDAYILSCLALRRAFCLASPSGSCFTSATRASACASKCSAVKKAILFFCRMHHLKRVQGTSEPIEGIRLGTVRCDVHLMDMAASCARSVHARNRSVRDCSAAPSSALYKYRSANWRRSRLTERPLEPTFLIFPRL
jgi:hypothetical protein